MKGSTVGDETTITKRKLPQFLFANAAKRTKKAVTGGAPTAAATLGQRTAVWKRTQARYLHTHITLAVLSCVVNDEPNQSAASVLIPELLSIIAEYCCPATQSGNVALTYEEVEHWKQQFNVVRYAISNTSRLLGEWARVYNLTPVQRSLKDITLKELEDLLSSLGRVHLLFVKSRSSNGNDASGADEEAAVKQNLCADQTQMLRTGLTSGVGLAVHASAYEQKKVPDVLLRDGERLPPNLHSLALDMNTVCPSLITGMTERCDMETLMTIAHSEVWERCAALLAHLALRLNKLCDGPIGSSHKLWIKGMSGPLAAIVCAEHHLVSLRVALERYCVNPMTQQSLVSYPQRRSSIVAYCHSQLVDQHSSSCLSPYSKQYLQGQFVGAGRSVFVPDATVLTGLVTSLTSSAALSAPPSTVGAVYVEQQTGFADLFLGIVGGMESRRHQVHGASGRRMFVWSLRECPLCDQGPSHVHLLQTAQLPTEQQWYTVLSTNDTTSTRMTTMTHPRHPWAPDDHIGTLWKMPVCFATRNVARVFILALPPAAKQPTASVAAGTAANVQVPLWYQRRSGGSGKKSQHWSVVKQEPLVDSPESTESSRLKRLLESMLQAESPAATPSSPPDSPLKSTRSVFSARRRALRPTRNNALAIVPML